MYNIFVKGGALNMNNNIRESFKNLRKKINVTQEQMALFLGLEQSSISKFENGERTLNVGNLEKACSLFGVSYHKLLENTSEVEVISPAFRKTSVSVESLNDVSEINKIALNILEMNKMIGN
jgi:transcriptional regulator with XRE-family HTH domain